MLCGGVGHAVRCVVHHVDTRSSEGFDEPLMEERRVGVDCSGEEKRHQVGFWVGWDWIKNGKEVE